MSSQPKVAIAALIVLLQCIAPGAARTSHAQGATVKPPPPGPGTIIGVVELIPGIPVTQCLVLLEGTPLGARCDERGVFIVTRVMAGTWDLRIASGEYARRVTTAANPEQVTSVGAIPITRPGYVSGQVLTAIPGLLGSLLVGIPAFGIYASVDADGAFLLSGVPPGRWEVVALRNGAVVRKVDVEVKPARATMGVDFDFNVSPLKPGEGSPLPGLHPSMIQSAPKNPSAAPPTPVR